MGVSDDSVTPKDPEPSGRQPTDSEERDAEPGEPVRDGNSRRPWECDHVHERRDDATDTREHPAEEEREIGRQFRWHTPAVTWRHRKSPRSRTSDRPIEVVEMKGPELAPTASEAGSANRRGQANLTALAAALFALTTVTVLGVAVANGALLGELRDADERHAATAVADGLVSSDSQLTNRSNVLDRGAVATLDASTVRARYPVLDDRSFRITLDNTVVAATGRPDGGTTRQRIVLVERRRSKTLTPPFPGANRVTLPRRTPWVELDITPRENVSVRSVRANDRTVLHDPSGLDGRYTVDVSRRETVRFTFMANASLERGDVSLTLAPGNTTKAQLGVTVDD